MIFGLIKQDTAAILKQFEKVQNLEVLSFIWMIGNSKRIELPQNSVCYWTYQQPHFEWGLSGVTSIVKQLGGYSTKSHVKLKDFVYNREINTGIVPLCLGITKWCVVRYSFICPEFPKPTDIEVLNKFILPLCLNPTKQAKVGNRHLQKMMWQQEGVQTSKQTTNWN